MMLHLFRNIVFFILVPLVMQSQQLPENPCVEVKSNRAIKYFKQAMENLETGHDKEGYRLLMEAVKTEPEFPDAYYQLAQINLKKAQDAMYDINEVRNADRYYHNAERYFLKTIKYCSKLDDYRSYYYLGIYYYQIKNLKNTLDYLQFYLAHQSSDEKLKKNAQTIINKIGDAAKLIENPVPFNPQKLAGINTAADEFLPLISPDGELALFTRRYPKFIKETQTKRFVDEFTYSERQNPLTQSYELFNKGTAMPPPFNVQGVDQGAASITIDNKHLYMTICQFVKGKGGKPYKNCDIYVSDFEEGKWTTLKNLGPNINRQNTWESQPSISADGKTLYFASVRPGNIGFSSNNSTIDIYTSTLKPDNTWTKAKNLGQEINTRANEKSPFIHTDSQTLYFSSDGRNGLGGYDIYFSQLQPNGHWSKPKNIGYPINTEGDDLGFIVSTNGEKAYFSSDRIDESTGWDIYSFELYQDARPHKVLFAKGKLVDDQGNVLTDAKVEIKSVNTNKTVSGMVDKKTGDYAIAIATEKDDEYLLTVKKKDFAFTSTFINPKTITHIDVPLQVNMEMKPVKVGETVEIKDIHFATNSANFDRSSLFILDNFVDFLKENPKVKIGIQGHTDNVGDPKANMELSQKRAQSVRDYLILMGIKKNRIAFTKGFGETKPVATNLTSEGRAQNRRTEFVIVEK